MRWEGAKEFQQSLAHAHEIVQTYAAREVFEVAKDLRDEALDNFGAYGIRMVTGRSRALMAAEPGPGLFERGTSFRLEAYAGYTTWPDEGDTHSGGEPVPFYPHYLNYGTARMAARPYWTAAVETIAATFHQRMATAVDRALDAYLRGLGRTA